MMVTSSKFALFNIKVQHLSKCMMFRKMNWITYSKVPNNCKTSLIMLTVFILPRDPCKGIAKLARG